MTFLEYAASSVLRSVRLFLHFKQTDEEKRAPQRSCSNFEVLFDFIPQEFYGSSVRSYAGAGKSAAAAAGRSDFDD